MTSVVCQVKGCRHRCGPDMSDVCKNQHGHVSDSAQKSHLVGKRKLIK